ncbi:MAG: toprim domain-containing protein [Candidatus Hodarchaeota archaeon]
MDKEDLKRKRSENLQLLFEDLVKEPHPILVEGPRDRDALVQAGIPENRIFMLHGKSLLDVEELLSNNEEVILLLDYDKEGLKLHKHFKKSFQKIGVKPNVRYWKNIRRIFTGHIDCIEYLKGYF